MEKVNGHAPFSSRKSWITATRSFLFERQCSVFWGDLAIKTPFLATGEWQCSVFFERFSAFSARLNGYAPYFFQFHAGYSAHKWWIKPLRVGGHAPFSPLLPFIFIRYYSSLFSFSLRYSIALQSKTKRSSIEHLSNIYRRPIEHLSKTYRRPIEVIIRQFYFIPLHCLSVAPYFPNFTVFTFEPEEMVRR